MTKARDIASAIPAPSTVSSAELGYLDGVTSAIQTQVDAKTAKATLTTTGDIYYASSASTPARLGIGSTDQVLKVTAGVPAWATPAAGGGMTSLASGSIAASATGFDLTSISGSYNELWLYVNNYSTTTSADIELRSNNVTATDYTYNTIKTDTAVGGTNDSRWLLESGISATQTGLSAIIRLPNYANTTGFKHIQWQAIKADNFFTWGAGFIRKTEAINRLTLKTTGGTFDTGTYELFGVK